MINTVRPFVVFVTLISLLSCKSKPKDMDKIVPANELYSSGMTAMKEKKYKKAAELFEQIFFQHPGGALTADAELMQAYALYLEGEYGEVEDILKIFVKLHPRHKDIIYAYYLKALSNYVQISDVQLDQSKTKKAKKLLEEIITRYPGSKYAIDAALKIDLVNDHLAGKEMLVGRYYLSKKNPIAAIRRFQTVIQEYQTTTHTPEALYRLVEGNCMLGLYDEAEKYLNVLTHNYPKEEWTVLGTHLLKAKQQSV